MPRRHSNTNRKASAKRSGDAEREDRVAQLAAQLSSSTHYWSESSKQLVPIAFMPIPHAEHALAKLERMYGDDVHETPLAHSLQRRVDQAGTVTEVTVGESTMMRDDKTGKFTGAVRIRRVKR
jgi:hypothetical protein